MPERDERRSDMNDDIRDEDVTDEKILAAVAELEQSFPDQDGFGAKLIASTMKLRGIRRLGVKSSRGNWSGRMSPALRISAKLKRLYREGELFGYFDDDGCRMMYRLPRSADDPYVKPPKVEKPKVERRRKPDHMLPGRMRRLPDDT